MLIKNALRTVVQIFPDEKEFIENDEVYPDFEKLKESAEELNTLGDIKSILEICVDKLQGDSFEK